MARQRHKIPASTMACSTPQVHRQTDICRDGPPRNISPRCLIYSNHPLALSSIKDAVSSDPRLRAEARACVAANVRLLRGTKDQILVLDTCSIENWITFLDKWNVEGGPTIALVSSDLCDGDLELQMLYRGVAGVLRLADLADQLPRAIHAVAEGQFWYRRDALHAYVKQTRDSVQKYFSAVEKFTTRENELIGLLQQDLPNRLIAQKLSISERTVKFHISNILRKLKVSSRAEIRAVNLSPDFLNAHERRVGPQREIPVIASRNSQAV